MSLVLAGLAIIFFGGLAALAAGGVVRRHGPAGDAEAESAFPGSWASFFGAGGALAGCAVAFAGAVQVLLSGGQESLRAAWNLPIGGLHLQLDALSAFFLLPILGVSGLAALYGAEYLRPAGGRRRVGVSWFCYNALIVSMAMVVSAHDGILFLLAWEAMALTSFFLVLFDHEREEVRRAAWTYLIASHLGTAFVIAFFVILGRAGSFDFDSFAGASAGRAGLLFIFAVIGFGTKAGFMPLHVWLPEAHPAAPSHVSAVMSGVMMKTGIYGLLRAVMLLGAPGAWWGWLLIAVGLTSGIAGVLFALAQHDLKRLLAYHSVENIGIIALGMGVGLVGISTGTPVLAALGFAGALLHVVNHALFKGLLFLGAGSVQHGTGEREMDRLGGLLKRMPWTAATFLIGAAAISGLPPLNGFVSEFLIYLGAFRGGIALHGADAMASFFAIFALALIGGLATACFAKAFGIVFLGEPRSESAARAHEAGPLMLLPMVLLAAACAAIGLLAPMAIRLVAPAVVCLAGGAEGGIAESLQAAARPMTGVVLCFSGFLALTALLCAVRRSLAAGRANRRGVPPVSGTVGTWDCGYARPTARMQYTASSFAQPLTDLFRGFLGTRIRAEAPRGAYPAHASFHSETPDLFMERCFRPLFDGVVWLMAHPRRLQHGRVQLYVLYVALTLVALLIWFLGWLP